MGKQTKSKKPLVVGKGKVTPLQTAFIVDRYLSDNGYTHARSTFRLEAADLISNSPVHEAPKSMLSLAAILDEYITMKEKKVWVDQERCRLEQEKLRVNNLLVGLQGVMNAYNAAGNDVVSSLVPIPVPQTTPVPSASQSQAAFFTPAASNGTTMLSKSRSSHIQKAPNNSITPVIQSTKRKAQRNALLDVAMTSKRAYKCTKTKDDTMLLNSTESGKRKVDAHSSAQLPIHEASVNGSNVVKCLFHQETPLPPTETPVPKTPPRTSSSETEKSSSPLEMISTPFSAKGVSPRVLSANCTIISSETIRLTPSKQISYYSIEKNHVSSCSPHLKRSSVKDHVRGRLDFGSASDMSMIMETQASDGNSTSESDRENNILDMDFSNLDAFGLDFNLSEFLLEFDVGNEGHCLTSSQGMDSSPDFCSSSQCLQGNSETAGSHFPCHLPEELMGGKDLMAMTLEIAPETISTTRSITKRVMIVSPVKSRRSNLDEEHKQA